MKSPTRRLKEASELAAILNISNRDFVVIDLWHSHRTKFHLRPEAFVRSFHELGVRQKALDIQSVDGDIVMSFVARSVFFVAVILAKDAPQFRSQLCDEVQPKLMPASQQRLTFQSELPRLTYDPSHAKSQG